MSETSRPTDGNSHGGEDGDRTPGPVGMPTPPANPGIDPGGAPSDPALIQQIENGLREQGVKDVRHEGTTTRPLSEINKSPGAANSQRPHMQAHPLDGLTEGRIVHYMVPHPELGLSLHRPAIVTQVKNHATGVVDLTVFLARRDFPKDQTPGATMMLEDVAFNVSDKTAGTWHFPERAPAR